VPNLASAKNIHLRDQIMAAARSAGLAVNPKADDGIEAYLTDLAQKEPRSFAGLVGRCLPLMPVKVEIPPIEKAADLVGANSAILAAASAGDISTGDASALGSIVGNVARAIELADVEARLAKIEASLEGKDGKRTI
jgi:hypothetical protein